MENTKILSLGTKSLQIHNGVKNKKNRTKKNQKK